MSPTVEARKERRWTKWIAIYIAIVVTVLAWGVWESVGVNNNQNRAIATQARAIALANREANLKGCQRGNFLRGHINVINNALSGLVRKSIESSPTPLTADQEHFVQRLYRRLTPLKPVKCKREYGRLNDPRASTSS